MILFKPLAQVFQNEADEFFLHCVSYFNNTLYENDDYEPLPSSIDADGIYRITLKVRESQIPALDYITPVLHVVPLGTLDLSNSKIEVRLTINSQVIGQGIVIDIDTKENTRPTGGIQTNNPIGTSWL